MAKRNYLALLAILLLAFALRVYRLDSQSLWYDEAVTAQVASQGIGELTRWTADDIQPPLYYYVAAGWLRLAGRGEWALRFPSAFFGTLTVPLMWAVALRLFGRGRSGRVAALAAALLTALSPLYVYYAQEARMYTLLTFLGLLAGYALLRATADAWQTKDEDGRRRTKDEGRRTAKTIRLSSFVFRPSNGGSSSSSLPPPCSTPTTSAYSCCWLTGCVSPSVGWLLWRGAGLAGGRWPRLPLAA